MADFDGQLADFVELQAGWTAAQLIANANAQVVQSLRLDGFGPGWFLKEPTGDAKTGKAECDG